MHHSYMHHEEDEEVDEEDEEVDEEGILTRPERPKGVKDEVKPARRATNQKLGPGGPPKLLVFQYFASTKYIKCIKYIKYNKFIKDIKIMKDIKHLK